MKNICLGCVYFQKNSDFENAESFVEDPTEDLLWVANLSELRAFSLSNSEIKVERIADWSAERNGANLIDLQLLYDCGEISAVLSDGSLLIINCSDCLITKNELAPSISAASWSPDLSTLTISDGSSILFFDRNFDLVSMCELKTSERGKDEQVAVGWGTKETQFQGSVGKAARDKPIAVDRKAYEDDLGKDYIRWRADGEFVFISHKEEESSERHIMIFNKTGELMSRLKNIRPFEECFAVKPIGNYIATTTRNDDASRRLIFFERNGEIRHEYDQPTSSKDEILMALDWDMSGSALMFHFRDKNGDRIELWTVSNYDWTRKWAHCFSTRCSKVSWNTEKALTLSIITEDGRYSCLYFSQKYVQIGTTVCVASTDGFRMSDFSKASIPPPMSEYILPSAAHQAFGHNNDTLAVILLDWTLHIYKRGVRLSLEKTLTISAEPEWTILSSVEVADDHLIFIINGSQIVKISLVDGGKTFISCPLIKQNSLVSCWNSPSSLWAITKDGDCFELSENPQMHFSFPQVTSTFYNIQQYQNQSVIQDNSNDLYLDGVHVASAVRSFLLIDSICAYITLQNQIFFKDITDWSKPLDKERSVELGSELVTCVPSKMSLIMQMPRGNLETIYPRIIVVQNVRELIKKKQYVKALIVMKKHRINMNILVDEDYEAFKENSNCLFEEESTPDLVDLFIASVSNELSEFCTGKPEENKIEKVANLMEKEILAMGEKKCRKFFTVLLSALLKHSRPKVEEALQYIKQYTDKMENDEKDHFSRFWLHHVGFFVGEKEIFNAALATYDLRLTVQVAEATNRDPKEYLPLLNELRKIEPEQYRKYHIQLIREDWTSALRELSELPDKVDEATALIKNRNLYSQALVFFASKDHFNAIGEVVASQMATKGQWMEAAFLYEKTGNKNKSLECFEMSRDVILFHKRAIRYQISEETLVQKLKKMAIFLENEGKIEESCKALKLAKASSGQIIQLLAKSYQWMEAIECVKDDSSSRSTLVDLSKSRVDFLLTEIQTRSSNITKHSNRLEIVRDTKELRIKNITETDRSFGDFDAFSEAGSTISTLSRKTGKTGSSRASTTATVRKRKQIEKKKQSLKEGGEYEDSALLLVLHEQYKWIETTCFEAKKLLFCLIDLDLYKEASNFQSSLDQLCQLAKSKAVHIWPSKLQPKHLCGPLQLIYTVEDVITFPEDGGMPRIVNIEPEMVPPVIVDPTTWRLVCFQ